MTARPQDVALLPCPGCGGDSTRVIGGPGTRGGPEYWAGCDHCRWRTWGNTEAEAIATWNTRANLSAALASAQAREEELRAEVAQLTAALAASMTGELLTRQRDIATAHRERAERLAEALRDERAAERAVEAAGSAGWRPAYEGEEEAYYERLLAAQDAYQNARARTDALSTNAATQTGETNEAAE